MLGVLFSGALAASEKKEILRDEFGLTMTREARGEVDDMGSFAEALINDTLERGLLQGRQEGRKEEVLQGYLASARNLMASMGMTASAAMDALDVPADMRADIAAALDTPDAKNGAICDR